MWTQTIARVVGDRRTGRTGCRPGLAVLLLMLLPAASPAQDYLRSMASDPILVFSGDGHRSLVHRILYTHDGHQLLTAGDDKEVLIWNLAENPPRLANGSIRPLIWKRKRGAIYAMALSRAAGDQPGRLILCGYGIEDGGGTLTVFRYPGEAPGAVRDTGDLLAHWTGNGLDPANPLATVPPPGHVAEIQDLAFAPDGRSVASASLDQTNPIQVWDAETGRMLRRLSDARDPEKFQALALAYTPDGGRLVAGGKAFGDGPDGRLRIWDLRQAPGLAADSRPIRIAVDGGPDRPISARIRTVAVSPNGRWLVAGLAQPVPASRDPRRLSGLALIDLKAPAGSAATPLPFQRPGMPNAPLGEVFDAKFLDDSRFAIAVLDSDGRPTAEKGGRRDRLATWIQIRSAPDGRTLENVRNPEDGPDRPWPGIIKALAVSPDRAQLAFVEGERNRVVLKDLRQAGAAGVPLDGAAAGARAWEVGFLRDRAVETPAIAYSATRADGPAGPPEFDGFDLDTLTPTPAPVPAAGVVRAMDAYGDYRVRVVPGSALELDLARGNAVVGRIRLHPDRMGQWQRWSFLPPGPGHPRPCLAIACEFGVAIYTLDDLRACKRLLKGHSDHVLDLAPDPHGRWLVTGGADQTVRLWSLDGCDRTPGFGAMFRADRLGWIIDQIEPRSPADLQGLVPGDRPYRADMDDVQGNGKIRPGLAAEWDRAEPGLTLRLRVRRPSTRLIRGDYDAILLGPYSGPTYEMVSATKVDSPVLSLFRAGQDWIVWMPQGYYETSVQGDRFYLGWHINNNGRAEVFNPQARPRPTSFVPMITFQDRLRRPEVLRSLLETGSMLRALRSSSGGPRLAVENRIRPAPAPGLGEIIEPPDLPLSVSILPRPAGPNDLARVAGRDVVQANVAALPVRLRIEGQPGLRLTRVRVFDNGMEELDLANPAPDVPGSIDLTFQIAPGTRRKTVQVTADNDRVGEVSWDYERSVPEHPAGRLVILAYGPGFQALGDYQLDHSPKDAEAVGDALADQLLPPWDSSPRLQLDPQSPHIITAQQNKPAGADQLAEALKLLEQRVQQGTLGRSRPLDADFVREGAPVDTVALFVSTHLLASGSQRLVLGEAEAVQQLPGAAIYGEEMARSLGYLVRHGCRVLVFVDGVHLPSDRDRKFDVVEWARQLQEERVATYIASVDNRPSGVLRPGEGAFAWGIREVLAKGNYGDAYATKTMLTAKDLGDVITELVHRETQRSQSPQYCNSLTSWDYLPLVGRREEH
ncbi:MAG: WD40 repeat domain-containing protein [Isosphaeraceae bacterium]